MKNFDFKKVLPHVIVIAIFFLLTVIYFKPVVLDGKVIKQGDIVNHKGMSKEASDFREQYKTEPLWTNSMFGGMPAYQINMILKGNYIRYVDNMLKLGLPHPVGHVFLLFLGFYILMLVLKIDPWLGLLGSIAFALSSYFLIVLEAGHNSKAHAVAYMAPVLAGIILTYRGRYLLGGAITALFLALDLYANHVQITYYLFLFLAVYIIAQLYQAVKEKTVLSFVKASVTFAVAAILALGSNANNLMTTAEYTKYTTRGKSELTFNKENKTSGLDKDYATQWSYGVGESWTLLIPDYKGGGSGAIGNTNKDALKNVDPNFKEYISQSDQYWGDQPFTSGPVYAGAIIIFLFVLGLFIVEGSFKWVILITTVFALMLSWGKNFMGLTELFLDYVPGYNKFRAVSMILVVVEFTLPLLAVLALDKLLKSKNTFDETVKIPFYSKPLTIRNVFIISFVLTGGLALLFYIAPGTFTSFYKSGEVNNLREQITKSGNPQSVADTFLDNLEIARMAIFKSDAIRSFFLILLAAVVLWLYFKSKVEKVYILLTLSFFVLVDLWSVDRRYLNKENFTSKEQMNNPFTPTQADLKILEDKDPDYRVLNMAVSTFNDASTSYYHKSIGGYHGAKLKRYQELIDFHIDGNMQAISNTLRANPNDSSLRATLSQQAVLNMLNTRYVIYNGEAAPIRNRYALGNAWFINKINYVATADSEITALANFNPRTTAVINEKFKTDIGDFNHKYDSTAYIKMLSYKANELTYESNSAVEQLAVFSEIYYKDGWNAYVDGVLTNHVQANYVLRAMKLLAGKHTIVFKFEPSVYAKGEMISRISSGILLLSFAGVGFMSMKKKEETPS